MPKKKKKSPESLRRNRRENEKILKENENKEEKNYRLELIIERQQKCRKNESEKKKEKRKLDNNIRQHNRLKLENICQKKKRLLILKKKRDNELQNEKQKRLDAIHIRINMQSDSKRNKRIIYTRSVSASKRINENDIEKKERLDKCCKRQREIIRNESPEAKKRRLLNSNSCTNQISNTHVLEEIANKQKNNKNSQKKGELNYYLKNNLLHKQLMIFGKIFKMGRLIFVLLVIGYYEEKQLKY